MRIYIYVNLHICNNLGKNETLEQLNTNSMISCNNIQIFPVSIERYIILQLCTKKRAATKCSNPSFITTPYDNRMWSL